MARDETAIERQRKRPYKKPATEPGNVRNLDEFQQTFLSALESIGEPKKPVKYVRPIIEAFKGDATKDTSLARLALFLSPSMRTSGSLLAGEDVIKKLERMEGEKDYISGFDEIRKGIDAGGFDTYVALKSALFTGLDYTFNTSFLESFDEMMKDPKKQPDRPETWRGDLVALMVQFGIPGGIIQKSLNRTKTFRQVKNVVEKMGKTARQRKISKIASRSIEGMTVVGATDFLVSEPGRQSLFFEPEATEGLTGRKRAAAEFRNKIKYGAEGTLIGLGFPIVGKALQQGYKYGLAPFVKTTASLGAKGINNAVFRPITYLGSREAVKPVVTGTAKGIRNATDFVLTKAIAPTIVSAFSGKIVKQLPPFEQWRLYSVTNPNRELRVIKKLDNILSYFRSFGKNPKDIEGVSEQVMLFIKGRARKLDRTMEGIEKKAYNLAKGFEKQHNSLTSSPALQKHYLDQVEQFLRDQIKKTDLPKELQPLAADLKKEIANVMREFQKSLPKGKNADKLTKQLASIEASRINSYLIKSFSTFTNPNYAQIKKYITMLLIGYQQILLKKIKI